MKNKLITNHSSGQAAELIAIEMIKNIDLNNMDSVSEQLSKFIWNFKHGDNIIYNFKILHALYVSSNGTIDKSLFNKPITITIVSIIEAILIDFLTRIDQATKHLPASINKSTLDKIQNEIKKDKKPPIKIDDQFGQRIYMRRKMYHYKEIVKIFKKYELLGPQNETIYQQLDHFGEMRNRVHIENYYGNLEERENKVFTSVRLLSLEKILFNLWNIMVVKYKRPW